MYAQLSVNYTNTNFYKVNVDLLREVSTSEEVSAMPTFKAYRDGKCVATTRGFDTGGIKKMIEENGGVFVAEGDKKSD